MTRIDWDAEPRLGRMHDTDLAEELGTSRSAVSDARRRRGIPPYHRRGAQPGDEHPRARFTEEQVREILRLRRRGWTTVEIAELVSEAPNGASVIQQGVPCAARTIGKITRGERYG